MKKLCFFALICLIIVSLAGCREDEGLQTPPQEGEPTEMQETGNHEDEAFGAYADTEEAGDADTEKSDRSYDDEGKLLLGDTLSFGLSYKEVKAQFPEVGQLQAEGGLQSLEESGLQEAVLKTEVLGHTAELEFNFEQDKLYSFYYFIALEDEAEAGELYSYLQNFYAAPLGKFFIEEQEEGGISSETSYWQNEAYQLGLTHQVNVDGLHFVSWGWDLGSS